MATPDEMAQSMINNLPEKTGHSLEEWLSIVGSFNLVKHGEIVKRLKSDYNVTHGYANLVAVKYREQKEGGAPSEVDLVEIQYKDKASLKPIYDAIINEVKSYGNELEIAPKKAYVSLRKNKQFALIQPSTKTRVDVGLNLTDKLPEGRLELSGSFNAMVSHRIKLTSPDEVDKQFCQWLREAFDKG